MSDTSDRFELATLLSNIPELWLALADAILAAGFVSPATLAVRVAEGKAAGVDLAAEELVKRDCFSMRTLNILDEVAAGLRGKGETVAPLAQNSPVKRRTDGLSTSSPKPDLEA